MQYWDDMNDKYGFSDGGAIPPDAEDCRTVYLKVINAFAEARGSEYRMLAYDRLGGHNWCLMVSAPIGSTPEDAVLTPEAMDDAMNAAIDQAINLDLDRFVETTVEVHWNELTDLLTNEV